MNINKQQKKKENFFEYVKLKKLIFVSQQEQERELRERERIQEEKIANALQKQRINQLREEKILQKIREDPELRELEKKLQRAYIFLEQKNQLGEKKKIEEREKVCCFLSLIKIQMIEKQLFEEMERERLKIVEREERKEREQREKNMLAKKMLEEQIHEREQQRLRSIEQFEKEKKQIDEIVERINLEDRL